jgi:hypothetical protein
MAKNHIIEGIISFPSLDVARPGSKGAKPKFGATIVVTKEGQNSAAFKALVEDVKEVATEKFGKKGASYPTYGGKHSTFRNDGADKGYPEGSISFGARNESAVGLVFPWPEAPGSKKPATVPQDKIKETFYPGAKVRVSVKPFAYDTDGNKGVGFALHNAQWLGHGERLDGRKAATEEFEADLSLTPESLDEETANLMG